MTTQPPNEPHEIERELKRLERQSEDYKLTSLKALLKSRIQDSKQLALLYRAC